MMKSVSQKKPATFSGEDVGKVEPDAGREDGQRASIPLPKMPSTVGDDSPQDELRLKITKDTPTSPSKQSPMIRTSVVTEGPPDLLRKSTSLMIPDNNRRNVSSKKRKGKGGREEDSDFDSEHDSDEDYKLKIPIDTD
jgi:hypothetical protein